MTTTSAPVASNEPGARGRCGMCQNTGWVELTGTTQWMGLEYERGCAPCRWCRRGVVLGECLVSGIDMRWGKGTPRDRPESRIPDVYLDAQISEIDTRTVSTDYERGAEPLMTLGEYAASAEGRADPHLAALRKAWAGGVVGRMPAAGDAVQPDPPAPGQPFQRVNR